MVCDCPEARAESQALVENLKNEYSALVLIFPISKFKSNSYAHRLSVNVEDKVLEEA